MTHSLIANLNGLKNATAQVGDVAINYWQGGDPKGRPILLWHGFLSTCYVWRKVIPGLISEGFSLMVPDMRGYGDSDKPEGTEGYDGRALAEDFRSLVQQTNFGNGRAITLVAHDMGAPPALLWAADYPQEIESLLYVEAPVMLTEVLSKIITFTPEAAKEGSMWWWLLPLAPRAPESIVVGNEKAFLCWFYEYATATGGSIEPAAIDEYLRTFRGREGVLGAMGVYRAAFKTIEQTEPLCSKKLQVPVIALGGIKAQGKSVLQMVSRVADRVTGGEVEDCGHFVPEERPDEIIRQIRLSAVKG